MSNTKQVNDPILLDKLESTISTLLPLWLIQGINPSTILVGACPLIVYGVKKLIGYFKANTNNGMYSKYVALVDKDKSSNRVYDTLVNQILKENKNMFIDEVIFDCYKERNWEGGEYKYSEKSIKRDLDFTEALKVKLYGEVVIARLVKREVQIRDTITNLSFLEISSMDPKKLNEMFDKLYDETIKRIYYYYDEDKKIEGIHTFEYDGERKEWNLVPIKIKKTFDNNPIDENIEKEIVDRIKLFDQSEDYYKTLGQPYKTGFLFHGKPGTGKTSFILTLANELNKKIYYGNESLIYSDFPARAMMEIKPGSLLVFEDVDLVIKSLITNRDKKKTDEKENDDSKTQTIETEKKDDSKISILNISKSGGGFESMVSTYRESVFRRILEVLDGYKFLYGIIVIFTTNFKEDLDSALIRPGRIDYCYEFKDCTPLQIKKISHLYGVNGDFTGEQFTSAELISKCKVLGKRKRDEELESNKKMKTD